MNITEFLEARIAEDEAAAKERSAEAPIHYSGCYYYSYSLDAGWFCDCDEDGKATARVLAECAAKRAIIGEHESRTVSGETGCGLCNYDRDYGWEETGPCKTVRALAAAYKDHPAYQPEWSL